MKGIFGLVGLLLTLAVVGVLVKKQLATTSQGVPALQAPVPASADSADSAGAPKASAQQVQEQYKQALEAAAQAPRAMPDDK